MLPKKGRVIPKGKKRGSYAGAIAYGLRAELGPPHQAIKVIMRWTGASERTVKNWLSGVSGPSGDHLVELMRHCDQVLQVLLALSGRQSAMTAQMLMGVRDKLAETVELIDSLEDAER